MNLHLCLFNTTANIMYSILIYKKISLSLRHKDKISCTICWQSHFLLLLLRLLKIRNTMNINDSLIIEKIKEGDKAVFRSVFEENYLILYRFATQILHDTCQAEEVADDVIVYLWEHRNELTINISLRSYLMQSVKNRCIDVLRSKRQEHEINFTSVTSEDNLEFLDIIFTDENHPMGMLIQKELEAELMDSIEKLPPECKTVFIKSRFEQKKYEEIAEELNISINTVKYHIKNALAYLQNALSSYLKCLLLFFFLEN